MAERKQVVDMMAARAQSSASQPESDGLNLSTSFDMTSKLHRQNRSLENEVQDLKRLLLDCTVEKKELQEQKDELQALVDELMSSGGGSAGGGGGNGSRKTSSGENTPLGAMGKSPSAMNLLPASDPVITDRAKKTMMHLRLERTEEKRKQLQDTIRAKCTTILSSTKHTRAGLKNIRTEFQEQMSSFQELLESGIRNVKNISERAKESAAAASPASAGGAPGDYLSMVTAAVQEQQKNIVLSPEHPVVKKLSKFLDTFDGLIEELNKQWGSLECFSSGKPPHMMKPRRYIDPSVNLTNYTSAAATMRNYVSHSCIMSLLYSDMTLPELERRTHDDVRVVFGEYTAKLDALYDAMRAIRTPVVIRKQSIGNILRIGGSIDVVKEEIAEIQSKYELFCKQHTARCFKYISGMLCIGRKFAESRSNAKFVDEWVGAGGDDSVNTGAHQDDMASTQLLMNNGEHGSGTASPEDEEEDLKQGGDYHNIIRHTGERRRLYIQRRDLMKQFTGQRLVHIESLSAMVEDIARTLRRHRLISEESSRVITGQDYHHVGSSGGRHHGQHHGQHHHHAGSGHARSPQTTSLSAGGGTTTTGSSANSGGVTYHQVKGVKRSGNELKYRFTAHEQLVKSGQITSSSFYFENKRKHENKFRAHHRSGGGNGGSGNVTVEGSPKGSPRSLGGKPDLSRKDTLSMVRDMDILQRLSPRKPNTPHAFERQKPVRMLPKQTPQSQQGNGAVQTARAVTTGTMQRPPLGATGTNNTSATNTNPAATARLMPLGKGDRPPVAPPPPPPPPSGGTDGSGHKSKGDDNPNSYENVFN